LHVLLQSLTYWGSGKNRFQMEVPDSIVKHVPDEYEVTSQKKGSRRYRTPQIVSLLSELTDAEERRDAAQRDTMRRIFFQFDQQYVNNNNNNNNITVIIWWCSSVVLSFSALTLLVGSSDP